jgi:uncharacterized protein
VTRILAFSDLHGNPRAAAAIMAAAPDADLILGAGDFCNMRQGLGQAMALLTPLPCPAVLVPGNAESAGELTAAAPDGATVLHGSGTTVAGLTIFGLGYGVPVTPFGAWSCDLSEAEAADALAACDAADILLLHSPPKGIADRTSSGASVGSTAIRDAIARIRPRLALCGHIHDSWGQEGTIGPTRIVNLGPRPTWFEL